MDDRAVRFVNLFVCDYEPVPLLVPAVDRWLDPECESVRQHSGNSKVCLEVS